MKDLVLRLVGVAKSILLFPVTGSMAQTGLSGLSGIITTGGPSGDARLTEAGSYRLTEAGDYRLVE